MRAIFSFAAVLALTAAPVQAATATVTMEAVTASGTGPAIGAIVATDSKQGLVLTPMLTGLPPGPHGIHVHQNADCGPKEQDGKAVPGLAAGGHFDPHATTRHRGPWQDDGHKGDLPALAVNGDGAATDKLVAPHLKVADLKGRAIIIHAGADNYSDDPKALGGGGARIACGVVK